MVSSSYEDLPARINELISELNDSDGLKRKKARQELVYIGKPAVPDLIQVAANHRDHARWEAIKALGKIKDPASADVLIASLMDEDTGIRWAASNALVALDRAAVEPLLLELTRNFDSVQLREVAHHILHILKDRGRLRPAEIKVYEALEGVEPSVEVPWAAEAALEDLMFERSRRE